MFIERLEFLKSDKYLNGCSALSSALSDRPLSEGAGVSCMRPAAVAGRLLTEGTADEPRDLRPPAPLGTPITLWARPADRAWDPPGGGPGGA